MEIPTLPEWFINGFEAKGYTCLPMDFCHFLITKDEFTIEVFQLNTATPWYRAFATVDGDTYISIEEGFIKESNQINVYLAVIEPRLENLLDCLLK